MSKNDRPQHGKAMYDFTPEKGGSSAKIPLKKGDILKITSCGEAEGWWWGTVIETASGDPPTNAEGFFPAKFVKLVEEKVKFERGDTVKITGLERKFPKFDGQIGTIKKLQNGLFAVKLKELDNITVRVRACNLIKYEQSPEEESSAAGEANSSVLEDEGKMFNETTTSISAAVDEAAKHQQMVPVGNARIGGKQQLGVVSNYTERVASLESENRTLRLRLKQLEQQMADQKNDANNNDASFNDIVEGDAVDVGTGWEQGIIEEMSKFMRRTAMKTDASNLITKCFIPLSGTFKIDEENKFLRSLIKNDDDQENVFDPEIFEIKVSELRSHIGKASSSLSVDEVRSWVENNRAGVSGCCKELWNSLMDKMLQSDAEHMGKLLSDTPLDEDSRIAAIFQECIVQPLRPLFKSNTEERLEVQSKLVQECLRKISSCNKQAAEERVKKSAKAFIRAKSLDSEAQSERMQLLKHVQRYRDIIASSVEFKISGDIEQRGKRFVSEIEKLSDAFVAKKERCDKDLKTIYALNEEVEEREDTRNAINQKHLSAFENFLKEDKKERMNNLKLIEDALAKEKTRQVRFVDTLFSELVRLREDTFRSRTIASLKGDIKVHRGLIQSRKMHLTQGQSFMKASRDLLGNFTTKALEILRAQQQHINSKKTMLEALASKEYSGLKSSVHTQESKLRENISKIKLRLKKKEKELEEAMEAEDVDDIEECESMIEKYKARRDKMGVDLEQITKMKKEIEANELKL
mmetsp:Transcript_1298/g.1882  ORF Transcript_1298/g.1882 Transcript_1298/m.1882 type:complete len:750 (-) Transcript_1298:332-2581(-)